MASQIEHSEPYQESLQHVLKLVDDFQRELTEPQRAIWLALEDALLEHADRTHRAYFLAGIEVGERARARRDKGFRASLGLSRHDERSDILSMLARLIAYLARR